MRRARCVLLGVPLLAASLCGCRFTDLDAPPNWSETVRASPALVAPAPAPYRVGVLLPQVGFDPRELYRGDETRHASRPDPAGLRRELVEALVAGQLFARVEARGAPGEGLEAVEAEAWRSHDDLLLELELQDYHQAFLGHGDGYVPWLLTYVFWVWPAWWMPGESFGGGAALRLRLRDVQGRHEPLLDEVIRVAPEDTALTLTPTERDWAGFLDVGALWNLPASLEESNWTSVERCLGPRLRRELELRLLKTLRERVTAPLLADQGGLSGRVRKRLALVVGVAEGSDPRLGGAAHALEDAATMESVLASPAGGSQVAPRDLRALRAEQATAGDVLAALADIGSQTSASDEVIVYVAAQGTTTREGAGASPRLLLYDANQDDLSGSGLSLGALGEALNALPAGRVLLILDASFAGPGPGARTLRGTTLALSVEQLSEALGLGPGRALLLAAAPDQGARVIAGAEAGLFTQVLKEGIEGRADLNQDGRVTLAELYGHLRIEVSGRAGLERHEQTPLAIGLEPDEDFLGWPR